METLIWNSIQSAIKDEFCHGVRKELKKISNDIDKETIKMVAFTSCISTFSRLRKMDIKSLSEIFKTEYGAYIVYYK